MNAIEDGINDLAAGKMIIVVDDESRENEGDLLIDADFVTSEAINFMARNACGLICVPMEAARLNELALAPMTSANTDAHGTAFTVSTDHAETTTGISAYERALTIAALADPKTTGADFRKPGHVFPLAAREGGVLVRRGHTEAAIDLVRLARMRRAPLEQRDKKDYSPVGVICEIMNEDGTMARLDDLEKFAKGHDLKIVSVEDLVHYRRARETLIDRVAENGASDKVRKVQSICVYGALHRKGTSCSCHGRNRRRKSGSLPSTLRMSYRRCAWLSQM